MKILLPVLILFAIQAAQLSLIQARYISLLDQKGQKVDVGNVTAHETTVGQLKELISTRLRVDRETLILTDSNNNLLLDDEKLLTDYLGMERIFASYKIVKIRDDLTEQGEILVFKENTQFAILVSKDKTLGWLKRKALGDDENDHRDYRVYFDGKEIIDNSKTLGEYKLFKGACVVMLRDQYSFAVFLISPDASIDKFRLTMDTKVSQFKRMIENQGIPINNRLLTYNKIVLDDERRLSSYRKYYLDMTIYLVERMGESGGMLEMFYQKFDFVLRFPVFVIPNNTIDELKKYTFNVERSIPVERMKLKFSGQLLDDDDSKKISDYDLYPGAWVEVRKQ